MRYYAEYSESGKLLAILSGDGIPATEISKEEYDQLLAEIREKSSYVNKVYSGPMTIDKVPEKWRAEVQKQVDERKADEESDAQSQISDEEFARMVEGAMKA